MNKRGHLINHVLVWLVAPRLPPDLAIDAKVDLNLADGAYFLRARLNVSLPGLKRYLAQALADAAFQTCPHSKAIRGNVDVTINVV